MKCTLCNVIVRFNGVDRCSPPVAARRWVVLVCHPLCVVVVSASAYGLAVEAMWLSCPKTNGKVGTRHKEVGSQVQSRLCRDRLDFETFTLQEEGMQILQLFD